MSRIASIVRRVGRALSPGKPATGKEAAATRGVAASGAGGGKEKEKERVRLPTVLWSPQEEFRDGRRRHTARWFSVRRRILRHALARVMQPQTAAVVGLSMTAVLGSGIAEAWMITAQPLEHLRFVLTYGYTSIWPSFIWLPLDASLLCTSMGLDASEVLRALDPTNAQDAATLLNVQKMNVVRSVTSSFMLLAHIVALTESVAQAGQRYRDTVKRGTQPPLSGINGRVLRICGRSSDTTELALIRYGEHILPIYDNDEDVRHVVWLQEQLLGEPVPVYWRVRPNARAQPYSWQQLLLDDKFFLRTTTGRTLMYMEADGTNSDDVLGVRPRDLSFDDAALCFRMALKHATVAPPPVAAAPAVRTFGTAARSRQANPWKAAPGTGLRVPQAIKERVGAVTARVRELAQGPAAKKTSGMASLGGGGGGGGKPKTQRTVTRPFRTFTVYLGDSLEVRTTGGGLVESVRGRNDRTREVDVIIDSKAPILVAVLKWLTSLPSKEQAAKAAAAKAASAKANGEPAEASAGDGKHGNGGGGKASSTVKANGEEAAAPGGGDAPVTIDVGADEWPSALPAEQGGAEGDAPSPGKGKAEAGGKKKSKASEPAKGDSDGATTTTAGNEASTVHAQAASSAAVSGLDNLTLPVAPKPVEMAASLSDSDVGADAGADRAELMDELSGRDSDGGGGSGHGAPRERDWVSERIVCIRTSSRDYFDEMAALLAQFGVTAIDQSAVDEKHTRNIPCIFYFPMTERTAHAVMVQSRAHMVDPNLCCAVVDKVDGLRELSDLAAKSNLHVVCSAVIHDDLFRQVRVWARQGFTPVQIQDELDARFKSVTDHLGMTRAARAAAAARAGEAVAVTPADAAGYASGGEDAEAAGADGNRGRDRHHHDEDGSGDERA